MAVDPGTNRRCQVIGYSGISVFLELEADIDFVCPPIQDRG
jgi:hypothetical protein